MCFTSGFVVVLRVCLGSVVVVVVSGHLGVLGWTSLPWPCEASVEGYFLYNFF